MKVIFAQGNPGNQYADSRHNIGFFVLEAFAQKTGVSFADKSKFQASIAEFVLGDEKVLLIKPQTFYNDTGIAARALIDFYKLDPTTDFLAVHDELALPFGTIKTRFEGSDAGNNGVKSLNSHIGSRYSRIRIGIYNPRRDQMDDADFVLGKFNVEERKALPFIIAQATEYVTQFLSNELTPTRITLPPQEDS
jgi:PTH1 family peptidyl-tRNA hydrolase